jgi:hypothetical protein
VTLDPDGDRRRADLAEIDSRIRERQQRESAAMPPGGYTIPTPPPTPEPYVSLSEQEEERRRKKYAIIEAAMAEHHAQDEAAVKALFGALAEIVGTTRDRLMAVHPLRGDAKHLLQYARKVASR